MKHYFQVLRKYAVFRGRSGRREFWTFTAVYIAVLLALKGLDFVVGTFDKDYRVGLISGLYEAATLLPVIGLSVRRLHDTGRSGWWYLILFIPLLGIIQLLIFAAQESQPDTNQFGPPPLSRG